MNAIVENKLIQDYKVIYKGKLSSLKDEFLSLLNIINMATSKEQLELFFEFQKLEYFMVGFGGSHMWVKQLINGDAKQQVIFVKFE